MVDPSQVSLQSIERVVGEQHVEWLPVPLESGEFAHPLQVRRPLDIQVAAGRPSINASTTLANNSLCRSGSGGTGSASHRSTSAAPTLVMTYRRRSGPAPCSTGPATVFPSLASRDRVAYTWL